MIKKSIKCFWLFLVFVFQRAPFLLADALPPKMQENSVIFSYEAPETQSISLGAEFNGWDMQKNPLTKDAAGIWSTTLQLGEGRYEYKFIVDGEWMSGANLVVEIKKDKQGKLYIPEPKAGPNTAYSGKIRFGGNLIGITNFRRFDDENRYRLDRSRFHFDLDMDVTITKEVNGFFRTELDSLETNRLSLSLFKSHIDFTPEWFNLRIFNNEKNVQFDNPLRLTDKQVSLRYDTLEFMDEPNPHRSLGLKSQGLNFTASPMKWFDIQGFLIDKSNNDLLANYFDFSVDNIVEDYWGLRAKRNLADILGIGLSYFSRTGTKWPYADNNNFFRDPTTLQGHTFDRTLRNFGLADNGKVPEDFKGWMNRSDIAFDLGFNAFHNLYLYTEYLNTSQDLVSVRRNRRIGLDETSDINWKLFSADRILGGVKFKWTDQVTMQIAYQSIKTDLGPILHANPANDTIPFSFAMQNQKSFDAKGSNLSGIFRYEEKEWLFGMEISRFHHDLFPGTVFKDVIGLPNQRLLRFDNYGFYNYFLGGLSAYGHQQLSVVVENEFRIRPMVKWKWGETLETKLFGNFQDIDAQRIFLIRETPTTFRENVPFVEVLDPAVSKPATFNIKYYEAIADLTWNIRGPFYLQNSLRYGRLSDNLQEISINSWSTYSAILYKPKKNIFVRLGWGVDPEGLDEDLKEDFDLREKFLFDQTIESLSKGSSVSQSLLNAEHALGKEKRISLRIEIKY